MKNQQNEMNDVVRIVQWFYGAGGHQELLDFFLWSRSPYPFDYSAKNFYRSVSSWKRAWDK